MQVLSRQEFLLTEKGALAKKELQHMVSSSVYRTHESYDASAGRKLAFLDRHLNYLIKHPYVSPVVYLSNLKVMTRIKR